MKMTMSLLGLLRLHRFSRKLSKTDCRMDARIQVLYTRFFCYSVVVQNISLARIQVYGQPLLRIGEVLFKLTRTREAALTEEDMFALSR